jgi:hypothetical protein
MPATGDMYALIFFSFTRQSMLGLSAGDGRWLIAVAVRGSWGYPMIQ